MRVLLINPPFHRLMNLKTGNFHLGLGYLATFLKANGHESAIFDMELPLRDEPIVEYKISDKILDKLSSDHNKYMAAVKDNNHPVWAEARKTILDYKPDLVGITAMSTIFASALNVAAAVKEAIPGCPVVVGGPHATILPQDSISNDQVDFLVLGEGEHTLLELTAALEKSAEEFDHIDGLVFKKDGKPVTNKPRAPEGDIDKFPYPDRDLVLNKDRYTTPDPLGAIITSRGCPFNCGFCGARNIWGHKVRFRNTDSVIEEIKEVSQKYGVDRFNFWDNTFTVNKKITMELLGKVHDNRLNIIWGCLTRLDRLDEELLKLMKKTGCGRIEIGVESGSPRILEYIGKETEIEQIIEKTELIKKSGIFLSMFFMIGFPPETRSDIQQTIDFMKKLDPDQASLSVFTAYPGTPIYEDALGLGLIPESLDWSALSHQSFTTHFVKDIPREEFIKIVKDAVAVFDDFNLAKTPADIQPVEKPPVGETQSAAIKRHVKHYIKVSLVKLGLYSDKP